MNGDREYNNCLPKQMYRIKLITGLGCNKTSEECHSSGGPDSCIRYKDVKI